MSVPGQKRTSPECPLVAQSGHRKFLQWIRAISLVRAKVRSLGLAAIRSRYILRCPIDRVDVNALLLEQQINRRLAPLMAP
jgi:hypothetical protein